MFIKFLFRKIRLPLLVRYFTLITIEPGILGPIKRPLRQIENRHISTYKKAFRTYKNSVLGPVAKFQDL